MDKYYRLACINDNEIIEKKMLKQYQFILNGWRLLCINEYNNNIFLHYNS